jgi:hypothetical protein
MTDSIITGIEAIQAILAPALGISATALLLLSLQNRYSGVIASIRLLNDERRTYTTKIADKLELDFYEKMRNMSVRNQIEMLFGRCRDVRNSILYIQGSILLFVLTSVSIAANLFVSTGFTKSLPLIIFVLGMISVLIGIIYSAKDVVNSYKVARIEVEAEE